MSLSSSEPPTGSTLPPHGSPPARAALHVDVTALTDRGRVRENNEDAFAVFRMGRYMERVTSSVPESELPSQHEVGGHLMLVADGLGGHEAGDVASRTAVMTAFAEIMRSPRWALQLDDPDTRDAEIRAVLSRARGYLSRVHATLREAAAADARLSGMGTTLTGLYVVGHDAFVLHVGDSKVFLMRGGELRQLTHDHTVAQEYADRGMIPQEEVPTHRLQHVLTRAVGGPDEKLSADMLHFALEDGDRWLLCSDGLTDMASPDDIAGVLREHPGSAAAARALIDLALARGGHDNVTVIVADIHAAPDAPR